MTVYKITTQFIEEFQHTIRADSKKEAEQIAHDLCGSESGSDYYWYDSVTYEDDENIECDNE